MPVCVLFGVDDLDMSRPEPALDDGLAFEMYAFEADRVDPRADQFDIDTGIDQCSERHVAADTG